MEFGIRMRALSQLRAGVIASAVLALVAAVWSVGKISLLPPSVTPRSLEMATASTQVVVDTPRSAMLDLRQNAYNFAGLTDRAVLLGNVIASPPVRAAIARRARVPFDLLRVAPPLTAKQPRPLAEGGNKRRTNDILKSNDQYRLSIRANPTVPVLDIYAQAPTAKTAENLANAAVDGLRAHLTGLAGSERTPPAEQIRLVQLGRARGAVINGGVEWQVALLAFVLTFAAACATSIFLSRVKQGWRMAGLSERTASG